ncbi:alpha/beta hydrolase fold domain-containing protein [Hoeflea alexandrii]|uniref:alpha/beta hydrolase fold domain-containing protein n=1 Tax=Hoeflea alexandrii TaxID=288436 RepID=UPI0022AF971B|nr:alpha/beta hydrolase [Hoeflea alexandrii]MCZ4288216.1 alpha/beta hydrolase [Hoeflea alexandrii]
MPSLTSHFLTLFLKASGRKRVFSDPELLRQKVARLAIEPAAFEPPKSAHRDVDITLDDSSGWPVYRLQPKSGTGRRYGVYLHGGAWINQIVSQQWNLVVETVARAGVNMLVPIYPLAPSGTAGVVVPRVGDMLAGLVEAHGAERVFAIGDSAGGQIALSSVILMREQGLAPIGDTILISPALDLTLSNPEVDAVEPRDPWLARPGIRAAIEMWRGDLPLQNPMVSPILADLHGLGPLTIFSGTRDITNPDTALLVEKARAAGVPVVYYEEKNLLHVYPVLYGPEAKRARRQIIDRLKRD